MSGIYIFFTLEAQRSTGGGIGGGIEDWGEGVGEWLELTKLGFGSV